MSEFLYHYHPVEPATWFYLSSLLTIGLFFKFGRLWSVRNLDLVLLILLAPGLLFIHYGRLMDDRRVDGATAAGGLSEIDHRRVDLASDSTSSVDAGDGVTGAADSMVSSPDEIEDSVSGETESDAVIDSRTRGERVQLYGYLWLFCAGGLLLVRLLADATMVRRPLLEPNLTAGGLTFIGCSLFVFLTANVISRPADTDVPPERLTSTEREMGEESGPSLAASAQGPGYALLAGLPSPVRKSLAIFAHLIIVLGMVLIGYWHFDNIVMGIGAATLYLMLPYTARMTNEMTHALPAASLVCAVLCYRRPFASGICMGMACGMIYYPLFLLPLWISFYWPRGLLRFSMGVFGTLILFMFVLFSSPDVLQNVRLMFGLKPPSMNDLQGIWDDRLGGWSSYYRIPVLAAFIALAGGMALWPAQKNLGTLLSCSAAILVASQFWHGYGGGTYMAWYLPLVLLTIFRPNLEDRVALTVLAEGWLPRRLSTLPSGKAA